jgi:hypothetical protein
MKIPNPDCPSNDCRYAVGLEMTTSLYYPPAYNKEGVNINPDGNITSGEMTCSTCNKKWRYSIQFGETTFQEV